MPTPRADLDAFRRAYAEAINLGFPAPNDTNRNMKTAARWAGEKLGLNRQTGLTLYRRMIEEGFVPPQPPPQGAKPEPATSKRLIFLEDEVRRLKREIKDGARQDITAEYVREHIYGIANTPPKPPEWLTNQAHTPKSPGVPITIWSDWHWGEVVDLGEMGGANEYSLSIAHVRLKRLVERTIDVCQNRLTNPDYPGMVICLGGDMISGDIHQELAETNETTTVETLYDLQDKLAWALDTMASYAGKLFVPCVVGNHGRATHKPRAKQKVVLNFEWLLYMNLQAHFKNDPRIQFLIPREADAHFKVHSHRYMLTHGDSLGVKGGDGIIGALGPIMRGSIKTKSSEVQLGRDFDTMLMGHWHQLLTLPGVTVNGSLKGFDEYARLFLRARPELPQQALWWNHPRRGPTFHTAIQVEDPALAPAEWIGWREVR